MPHRRQRWKGWRGHEALSGSFVPDGQGGWRQLSWDDRQRAMQGLPLLEQPPAGTRVDPHELGSDLPKGAPRTGR